MARLVFAIWLAGCAVAAPALPAAANPASPPGRLASPPDAFGSAVMPPPRPKQPMPMPMP
jgi:hypothetical protein